MPKWSLAPNISFLLVSQITKENIPLNFPSNSVPYSSYPCIRHSVSESFANVCPLAIKSFLISKWLYISPLNTIAISPVSLYIGCAPWLKSIMLSLLCPIATSLSTYIPSSSGPLCAILSIIVLRTSLLLFTFPANPHIPHISISLSSYL